MLFIKHNYLSFGFIWLLVGSLPGCGADSPPPDVPPDATSSCWDWIPAHIDECMLPAAAGDLLLPSAAGSFDIYRYDTGTDELLAPDGNPIPHTSQIMNDYRVLAAERFELPPGAALWITGDRPLVIAATGDITIGGSLDAGSRQGGDSGPGSNPSELCASEPAIDGQDDVGGGAGGGGGGYQGMGGRGGDGDSDDGLSTGGAGGGSLAMPMQVRGGCPGGNGGTATGEIAFGGAGGGAVELVSQTLVDITGGINAGGAGGDGSGYGANGGGGGGSGGYIGLDAPVVRLDFANLGANGGGGGEAGSDSSAAIPGGDGNAFPGPANGGLGSAPGATDGGNGGYRDMHDGSTPGPADVFGGGGGGGGVGYVLVFTELLEIVNDATVSPTEIDVYAQ